MIHLIGRRNGQSSFSDINVAKAMENMGIAVSAEDYRDLIRSTDPIERVAGSLWNGILMDKCGVTLPGTPRSKAYK